MEQALEAIVSRAQAEIAQVHTAHDLAQLKAVFLGKSGDVTQLLRGLGKLPPEERREMGAQINITKQAIQALFNERDAAMKEAALNERLASEKIDVTLPGCSDPSARLHPLTIVQARATELFSAMGFRVAHGPDIETQANNFDALNIPANHPARAMQDTFYLDGEHVLRTQTSPVQVREMKAHGVPIRLISPGRVYRCDSDQTHTPMFHQMEGLMIDEDLTFGQLKTLLQDFFTRFFDREVKLRFRASYFPFTEPSAEVDLWMPQTESWLEVLGCGMVHPNVLEAVDVDPDRYLGFAFGLGLDRLAMLYYGISDLRLLFANDMAFLSQF